MAEKDSDSDYDTRLDMDENDEAQSNIFQDDASFLSERAQNLLDQDIKEPDSMARDLLMDRYTNHKPNFKDFGEAVNFIMNTPHYTERIENLVKYERMIFFKQRQHLGGNSKNIETNMYSNQNQIFYPMAIQGTLIIFIKRSINAESILSDGNTRQ